MIYWREYLIILIFFSSIAGITGCNTAMNGSIADSLFLYHQPLKYYYDLKDQEDKFFLPYVLEEISGLSMANDEELAMVQDESGKVFFYNIQERAITNSLDFARPGDFEGVEVVGQHIFVIKSKGDLFDINLDDYPPSIKKIETPLKSDNDVEGLGYDPLTNSMLLACKDDGDIKGNKVKGRAVYSYSLEDSSFIEKEILSFSSNKMEDYFERVKGGDYDEKRIKFMPSGIAVHPKDNHFYLLASRGKMIFVMNRANEIIGSYPISPRVLNQPEGICFDKNGDMYLSSEGEGDRGYIVLFKMKTKSR